jgi:Zn-ribbon-containing, possibly RNA-binding protein and truncated derivatives
MSDGEFRSLADALREVRAEVAPATLLAAVQEAWPRAAGATIAAEGEPVAERDGVITVACRSATWAQELDLMQTELLARLREALGEDHPHPPLRGLRFTADAARRS